MAQKSEIEWTDATWNPVTGCTKIGSGCDHCYAERFAERWRGVDGHPYEQGFDMRLWPSRLGQPALWKKPRMIFVNSMSDLFHKNIPREFIDQVFDAMEAANWHVYQVLTKRSSLMRNYVRRRYDGGRVPSHIWLGVSVEDAAHKGRIEHLRQINSDARFISFEPLLSLIGDVDLTGVAWAIVGGESGPGARPMEASWATELRIACLRYNVAFFFKQWGGARPKSGGRLLEGEEWNGFPWQIVPAAIQQEQKGVGCKSNQDQAEKIFVDCLQDRPHALASSICDIAMENVPIRRTQLKKLLMDMRKRGIVRFDLPSRKKVPQNNTKIALA